MQVDIADQAKLAGMSDAEFDRWVEQQGGQPVSKELWEKLAKSGIFPDLPPRGSQSQKFARRAARGDRDKFETALDKVPAAEPLPGDE